MGTVLLFSPLTVWADEIVLSGTLMHEHTTEDGSCYTPIYHIHEGTAGQASANGCYTVEETASGTCNVYKTLMGTSSWGCTCGGTVNHRHYTGGHNGCGSTQTFSQKDENCSSCGYSYSSGGFSAYTHTYSKTVYNLGCGKTTESVDEYNLNCSLDSCIYTVTKEELAEGLFYQLNLSDANFSDNCLWENYESGKSEPTIKQTTFSCLVNEEYDSGDLYVTLTDAKGKAYILETITISKMKLVIIRDGVTHEIKKLFFDGQEIKHINFNGQKLF